MMDRICLFVILLLCALTISTKSYSQDAFPALKGAYLGQTPPGLTATPFAPGIVNTEEWGDAGGFSADMTEFFVARWRHSRDAKEPESVIYKKAGEQWHKIVLPVGERRPFYAPDGKTLHYAASYKERTAQGWSELKSFGPAFEALQIMSLAASAKGTLVMDERGSSAGDGILRYSRLVSGKWQDPKPLPKQINSGIWNGHPYIAPDESYLIWDGERAGGFGDADLYISFRQKDGTWGEAINLGDKVNTAAEERGAQVTPDGKYIFFNRMVPHTNGKAGTQSDLYWIDAQIIEDLRPKE